MNFAIVSTLNIRYLLNLKYSYVLSYAIISEATHNYKWPSVCPSLGLSATFRKKHDFHSLLLR